MGLLRHSATAAGFRAAAALLVLALSPAARAIETDQFYAWGRTIRDSTDVLNARVNVGIEEGIARVNERTGWNRRDCGDVVEEIVSRFRFVIFWEPELWAMNSGLVDRVPATREEAARYETGNLYAGTSSADNIRRMPLSPTIEVAGVRFGTDKLTHFFSEGYMQHGWRLNYVGEGLSAEEAERRSIQRGIFVERTLLGMTSSGVFSPADLEANYQGMLFYDGLCDGSSPRLVKTGEGWSVTRPFDLRDYVTPEWDESWQPDVFSERRWRKVLPMLRAYCPLLEDPAVRERRAAYAAVDQETPTERFLRDLVREGKIANPAEFSIERACE